MTLKEIYQEEKSKPTPAQIFINWIAEVTCRETSTVRQWLSGTQLPNAKAKERISAALKVPVEILFPEEDISTRKEDEV